MVHAVNRIVGIIGLLIIPLGSLLFFAAISASGDSLKLSVTSTVGAFGQDDSRRLVSLDDLGTGSGCCQIGAKEKVLLNSMKGIETLSRVDILCVNTGTITEPGGMEVTEIRPVKDAQDLEALAQYVEASMDQNDTMDAIRKFTRHKSKPALGGLDIQPLRLRKSMGPLPLNLGSMYWGFCICLTRGLL